jgi:hypothetical protein
MLASIWNPNTKKKTMNAAALSFLQHGVPDVLLLDGIMLQIGLDLMFFNLIV